MQNVLADLAIDSEAATATAMRVARAYDEQDAPFRRFATAVVKYWVCKRAPQHALEALECLGGNGYVEESGMPRLLRDSPLNSIWEGSGNVAALDVLRAHAQGARGPTRLPRGVRAGPRRRRPPGRSPRPAGRTGPGPGVRGAPARGRARGRPTGQPAGAERAAGGRGCVLRSPHQRGRKGVRNLAGRCGCGGNRAARPPRLTTGVAQTRLLYDDPGRRSRRGEVAACPVVC